MVHVGNDETRRRPEQPGDKHLVPLGVIASDRLKEYVERFKGHYSKAVGFRPTGWTYVFFPLSVSRPS